MPKFCHVCVHHNEFVCVPIQLVDVVMSDHVYGVVS